MSPMLHIIDEINLLRLEEQQASIEVALIANGDGGAFIHHAGTKHESEGELVSSGGRVLACTGIGPNLDEARNLAYSLMDGIILEGSHYRSDIGFRAL